MKRILLLTLTIFNLSVIFVASTQAQETDVNIKVSKSEWQEDLRFLAASLEKHHKNAFHLVSKKDFDREFSNVEKKIPVMNNYEIVVALQSLAAMIGDGHTFVATWGIQRFYPFDLYWFGDELRVVRTVPEYKKALGARLIKINGMNLAEIKSRLQKVIPQGENKWFVLNQSSGQIVRAELLAALKITKTPERAAFTFGDDGAGDFTLTVESIAPHTTLDWIDLVKNPPLYLQKPNESFWFTYLPDSKTVYVNFKGYGKLEENAKNLLAFIDEEQAQRLIIDMRQNGGGNYNLVRQHLIYQIATRRAINRKNRFFVVIGRRTFSAAMTNAIDFRRETDAVLIGEPPGARPNGYQENYWTVLPNSGLRISISRLYYEFMDTDVPVVSPDIQIAPNWKQYKAGSDPVIDRILSTN